MEEQEVSNYFMGICISYELAALSRHEPVTKNIILRMPLEEAQWLLNQLTAANIMATPAKDEREFAFNNEFHNDLDSIITLVGDLK